MATRAKVEGILIKRVGALMTKASLDGTTVDGTNADLNDPIGWALRQTAYTVSDISAVTTTEVGAVVAGDIDEFLDLAELRTLENVLGNLTLADTKLGPRSVNLGQITKQVEKRIESLNKKLQTQYGWNAPTLEAGLLTEDFAQHADDTVA